jgi:CBS domain-containing protein
MAVRELMMEHVVTCAPDDDLRHVMTLMTQHRVRHLVVMDRGRLAGIISIGDAVKYRLEELELETNVLRDTYFASH